MKIEPLCVEKDIKKHKHQTLTALPELNSAIGNRKHEFIVRINPGLIFTPVGLRPSVLEKYWHLKPKGGSIIILPCGPTLSLPHPVTNLFMINHSTSNRSALLSLVFRGLQMTAMSGHDTMGSRCVIDGGRVMFLSSEELWFRVTDVQSHPPGLVCFR